MPASRREDRRRVDGFELEIFKLVRKHATSNQWRKWLRLPLEHAAAKGDMDLFTRLMDAGADGDAGWRGCHGRTLLGAAAYGKSGEIVLELLKSGTADVDATFGAKRESALHVAAAHGAEQASNVLMLVGANPNALDGDRQSPLHLAAEAGHDGVVNTLLLKGAWPNAKKNPRGHTPLHLAAAGGHALCVSKLVVGGADKDSRDDCGETPLHLAAENNRLMAVEELVAAGASLGIRSHNGAYSALDMAAKRGLVDVVRAILHSRNSVMASDNRGFTVVRGNIAMACDNKGYTVLHSAANHDRALGRDNGDVIRVLLEAGADTEAQTTDGFCTPLHFAVPTDSRGSILALLEGGANVNARSADGYTPLHDACYQSCLGAVELLLRWGADEKLKDGSGATAGDKLGEWIPDEYYGGIDCLDEERKADDERIRQRLARAPADRTWRRRAWVVLARSCPAKVQLTKEGKSDGGGSDSCNDADGGGDGTGDEMRTDLERLVGRVVGLDEEGVFRLVVDFL